MATRHSKLLAEDPTVLVGLFWESKRKVWVMRAELKGVLLRLATIETQRELDDAGIYLVGQAIKEEMESWVF